MKIDLAKKKVTVMKLKSTPMSGRDPPSLVGFYPNSYEPTLRR